jgi:predicted Holliday junction resolvase-like endonuclease
MLDLLVVSEATRQKTREAVQPKKRETLPKRERPRRDAVRASSAAALRTLAERLEPSPSC